MGLPGALRLDLDYSQQRVKKDALSVLAQASYEQPGQEQRRYGFDWNLSSNFWQDPVKYTGMLMPNVKAAAWNTTFTGIYARMRKTDFSLTTSGAWREETNGGSGDYWLSADGLTADETAITTATFSKNQPMWVGYFGYNADVQRYILFECGWHTSATMTGGIALRFYSSGEVEVWKTTLQATYKVSGYNSSDSGGQQFSGVMLIPGRKRELLVIGSKGDGFSHCFTDLDETEDEPAVTAESAKFWVKAPYQSATRSFKCQVAKIQFPSSGTAVSAPLCFADAPDPGNPDDPVHETYQTYGDLYGGTLTPSLLKTDGVTPFVPDNVLRDCRVKVAITGTGARTPFLYGVYSQFEGILANTPDKTVNLADFCTEADLYVGESADSTSLGFVLARLDEVDEVVTAVRTQSNRPLKAWFTDGALVIGGRTEPPDWELAIDPSVETAKIIVKDRWKGLENYVFRDVVPLDGLTLKEVVYLLTSPVTGGDPARYDLDPECDTFTIPKNSSQTSGDWTQLIEVGDRASQWLDRIFDNYAGDWIYGFKPTYDKTVFFAKSPDEMGTTPLIELYDTWQQAYDALVSIGYSEDNARKSTQLACYRSFRTKSIEPEATEVRVTGYDPRSKRPIHVYKIDSDAEDPTVAVEDRPDNWLGEKRNYGWVDTGINSLDLAERCCTKLYKRLTVRRKLAEWTCGLLLKEDASLIWKGDCVHLVGQGVYRVTSIRCTFHMEPARDPDDDYSNWFWREATYCGELVTDEDDLDSWRGFNRPADLDSIVQSAYARLMENAVRASRGSEFLLKLVPETRTLAP